MRTKVFGLLQWATGTIAAAALLLSLAAMPTQSAWADEDVVGVELFAAGPCDVTCGGSYPLCGNGSCAAPKPGCNLQSCKLILAGTYKACECNSNP